MKKERCIKCGEETRGDGRNLWMACFYEMGELAIPFERVSIEGKIQKQTGSKTTDLAGIKFTRPTFETPANAETYQHSFYTLRVCKRCRAEWMQTIETWFNSTPETEETGTGVFVREDGHSRELTEAEIKKRWTNS